MADAVRLFVITWDPLAGMVERPSGFATTNGGSADLEIVVYLPTWSLVDMATARNNTLAAVMGAMAGSAVVTASHHEDTAHAGRYPDLAARGEVPDLLSDPAAGSALGAADMHFDTALRMADESDDVAAAAEVLHRLGKDTQRSAGEHSGRSGQREQPRERAQQGRAQTPRSSPAVAGNPLVMTGGNE
jgi:hypothetical protein